MHKKNVCSRKVLNRRFLYAILSTGKRNYSVRKEQTVLVNLHVKNLAIIDEVEVDFSDRLNVLTGETGAGKSIIIGSINLALGQKSPKDVIRKGTDYALVELTFRADTERQRALVEEMGISMEDDEILISRKIMAGRSVNRINGESVTLGHDTPHCGYHDRYSWSE